MRVYREGCDGNPGNGDYAKKCTVNTNTLLWVTLRVKGYDRNPAKLQLIIRTLFQRIKRRGFTLHPGKVVDATVRATPLPRCITPVAPSRADTL